MQNFKNKKKTVEDKNFEVSRDPLDGNIYLHIDPADLANMTPDEIEKISS